MTTNDWLNGFAATLFCSSFDMLQCCTYFNNFYLEIRDIDKYLLVVKCPIILVCIQNFRKGIEEHCDLWDTFICFIRDNVVNMTNCDAEPISIVIGTSLTSQVLQIWYNLDFKNFIIPIFRIWNENVKNLSNIAISKLRGTTFPFFHLRNLNTLMGTSTTSWFRINNRSIESTELFFQFHLAGHITHMFCWKIIANSLYCSFYEIFFWSINGYHVCLCSQREDIVEIFWFSFFFYFYNKYI